MKLLILEQRITVKKMTDFIKVYATILALSFIAQAGANKVQEQCDKQNNEKARTLCKR